MSHKTRFSLTGLGFAAAGLVAGGLMLAGFAGAPDRHGDRDGRDTAVAPRCLDGQHIGRKHVIDENTLLVYDDWGHAYKLGIGGPCRNMNDYSHIGFEFDGSDQICEAHDAKVLYSEWDEPPVRCVINSVKPLSKAEADELDRS